MQAYFENINMSWGELLYKLIWHNIECENKKLLDFGSGFGVTADHFAKNNMVTAIEPNKEMLKNRYYNYEYTQIEGGIEELKIFRIKRTIWSYAIMFLNM